MLFGAVYLAAVILLHGGYAPLREVHSLVRDMFPGSKRRAPEFTPRPIEAGHSITARS